MTTTTTTMTRMSDDEDVGESSDESERNQRDFLFIRGTMNERKMSGKKDAGRKHEREDERDKKKKKSGCWLMIISSRSATFC